jgi:transcriptional regulator with XRE-family HTH domain
MPFGDLIKAIRMELNITQEQLARELNISFSTINRWENGHTSPSKLAKMRLLEFCSRNNVDANITSELEKL